MLFLLSFYYRPGGRLSFLPLLGLEVPAATTPSPHGKAGVRGAFAQGQFLGYSRNLVAESLQSEEKWAGEEGLLE